MSRSTPVPRLQGSEGEAPLGGMKETTPSSRLLLASRHPRRETAQAEPSIPARRWRRGSRPANLRTGRK